ncbi:hypothetical protein ACX801_07850 [Arthrobacter bambusae]
MERNSSSDDPTVVPNVVGMLVWDAMRAAREAGLVLVSGLMLPSPHPDAPPLPPRAMRERFVVTGQRPQAGTVASRLGALAVEIEPDSEGLAGVRVPLVPPPNRGGMQREEDPGEDVMFEAE